ncbi:hypothetical protein ACHAWO_011261 [Cyclotella atomus]|uniref:7,8-diamino-pelargonic acid aminotransferase n=1 Tax=Cyclotella atomus TaxID=382360 RepID=A0ABD3P3R5_9STRA
MGSIIAARELSKRPISLLIQGRLLSTAAVVDIRDSPSSSVCKCDSPSCTKCQTLLDVDRRHVLHPYTSMTNPLPTFPVASAKGVHLKLNDGRKVIDGMSSWWAAMHGYRHPELDAAIKKQVEENMSHVMFGGLTHEPAVMLACRLLQIANNDCNSETDKDCLEYLMSNSKCHHFTKVFLCDSGSISVEVAMKMSIQYWFTLGQTNKTKFISLRNGYHGDTFGAMSICDPVNGMHSMFSGILAKQLFVPSPSGPNAEDADVTLLELEKMLQSRGEEVAAVVMEPIVQGAGGMKFYHPVLLQKARQLCDEFNILLIFDEIATGFGRTGALFAGWHDEMSYQPWSSLYTDGRMPNQNGSSTKKVSPIVFPDIVCLGKALTGGYLTMGATLTTDKVAHGISNEGGPFMHGPTFMGNPLACSVSLASLKLIQNSPWKKRVNHVRNQLINHLSPLASVLSVREVRVLGAIGVCELKESLTRDDMARVQRLLVDNGVWLRPFGKLLYTMPPFNSDALKDEHVQKIGEAMYNVALTL